MPSALIKSRAAWRPMIPGRFKVPDSKRSGRKSGISSVCERLPVPPAMRGVMIVANESGITMPPIPWGPRSPLCPVKHKMSIFISFILIGIVPAVCAESTMKSRPCLRQKAPTSFNGITVPQTLNAWVMITAFVFSLTKSSRLSKMSEPSDRQGRRSKVRPSFSIWTRGRMTALCSMDDTRMWSPFLSNPLMAMLRLIVTFCVKMTFFTSSPPNISFSQSRVR